MKTINEQAPIICRKKIEIMAKPERIWKILTDIDHWPKWHSDISFAKMHGPLQPDVSFTWSFGGMKIKSILHTVSPYYNIGWTGKALGLRAIHNWNIKAVDGATEVNVSESMEGIVARLFRKRLQPMLDQGMEHWLQMLKKECEKENIEI
jgi:hypothetical protein